MTTLNDGLTQINKEAAELAERTTKDSGEREVKDNGFQRDTDEDKFRVLEHGAELIELFLKHQSIDSSDALNTDYDMNAPNWHSDDYELIHPLLLNRLQALLQRGAWKYGAWNWQRGNNLTRSFESLQRHILQWYLGDTSEDHLAAAVCNLMFIMVHEHYLHKGQEFQDENHKALGKHQEFADAGALFWDDIRYNMTEGVNKLIAQEEEQI